MRFFDQIEDGFSKPSDRQQFALHDAFHMLITLRTNRGARHWRIAKDYDCEVPSLETPKGWGDPSTLGISE